MRNLRRKQASGAAAPQKETVLSQGSKAGLPAAQASKHTVHCSTPVLEDTGLRQQNLLRQLAQSGRVFKGHHIALIRQMQVEYQACSTVERTLAELRKRASSPETVQKLTNRLREHQMLHVLLARANEANSKLQQDILEAVQQGDLPEAQCLLARLKTCIEHQRRTLLSLQAH